MTRMSRPRRTFILGALCAVGVLLLTPGRSQAEGGQSSRAELLYNTYCVQCHGLNRNGKGVNTKDMAVQPRDHADPKGMGDIPDEELFKAIKDGGLAVNKSVLMPAWGAMLDEAAIRDLVAYLRRVCQCGPKK